MIGEKRPNPVRQSGRVKIGVVSQMSMNIGVITSCSGQFTFRIGDADQDIQKGASVQFCPIFGGSMAANVRRVKP